MAAAILISATDPGRLCLGGGLAAAFGARLRDSVQEQLAARLHPSLVHGNPVELSTLGDSAGLIGLSRICAGLREPSRRSVMA
jgi:predicted NBD/HSP70 family sugar kinase